MRIGKNQPQLWISVKFSAGNTSHDLNIDVKQFICTLGQLSKEKRGMLPKKTHNGFKKIYPGGAKIY